MLFCSVARGVRLVNEAALELPGGQGYTQDWIVNTAWLGFESHKAQFRPGRNV